MRYLELTINSGLTTFNRTSMESKQETWDDAYVPVAELLLIEPVWNRNINHVGTHAADPNSFNRTSMESKLRTNRWVSDR